MHWWCHNRYLETRVMPFDLNLDFMVLCVRLSAFLMFNIKRSVDWLPTSWSDDSVKITEKIESERHETTCYGKNSRRFMSKYKHLLVQKNTCILSNISLHILFNSKWLGQKYCPAVYTSRVKQAILNACDLNFQTSFRPKGVHTCDINK